MQFVNLYTQEFQPKKVVLPLWQLVLIPFVTVAILVVATYFAESGAQALETKAEKNKERLETLITQVEALEKRTGSLVRDESLVSANERLKKKLKARESMLDVLESVDVDEGEGFSKVLVSIARQHTSQLWLTEIEMRGPDRRYNLSGLTRSAEAVPSFLQNLRKEDVFVGHTFNLFSLEAMESASTLQFSLGSQASTGSNSNGPIMFSQLLSNSAPADEASKNNIRGW